MMLHETRIGAELCSKASAALGKFLKKRRQYCVVSDLDSCASAIAEEFSKGSRFVDKVYDAQKQVVLIFEEEA